jgi:hypothetical protein
MAAMAARFLGPMLLGPALKAIGIGGAIPRAPTGRAQASAGKPRRKKPPGTAGKKKKVSAKTLAALAKGRATAKRNRQRRR